MAEGHHPFRRSTLLVGLLCLGLVALADWLFHEQPLGLSIGLFGLGLLIILTVRNTRYLRLTSGRIVAAGVLGLILACLEQPGPPAVILCTVGLVMLATINRGRWGGDAASASLRIGEFLIMVWPRPVRDLILSRKWAHSRSGRTSLIGRIILAWLIPVVLTIVFLLMFWLANEIISIWLSELGTSIRSFFQYIGEYISFGRFILWLIVGWSAWGLLRMKWRWGCAPRDMQPPPVMADGSGLFDRIVTPALVVRCLILFNALFAVQTVLDVIYLWGGADLPNGLTYAEYAHRGAYPLVATALLAAAFVLTTFRAGSATEKARLPRRLVYLWIAQNVFLMVSAGWRLNLYVEAYTLTRLRIAAAVWMLLVAAGLIWIVWRIVRGHSNSWLINTNALTATLVLYICCFINFDGVISSYNVRHCREMGNAGGPPLDVEYLHYLGPESLPALYHLIDNAPDEYLTRDAALRAKSLEAELEWKLRDWRGWTWRWSRLEKLGSERAP